ncbi:Predicted flavoprotein CzcO associated with the cation diffusion facilitator CzcD [Streptomyces sp. 3213]|uniref:flavin-containing monooxygenase n=1 Tax=Streptomyces sp. 3213.3 TaxID=1855348 RepID=UPI000897DA1E|nr:NAD(P)/FAD-dependent oxidoreductase [Streptomyces sp. 3213.3]SEE73870.1 Predicted flavoprotein CzcO associated with the cation diffusion facilitator CzcD [Streptomyces sp. 3213] [Streptomyces sp. 3213.3]
MSESSKPAVQDRVDVLVIGAGVTGIYQLYTAREAGFSVRLVEAGRGVGGTWYWNRYPEARFDSESYTYGYLFSKELWEEWEWSERFAGQPEIERYFNHVVDRFDLRRHIRTGVKVTSAVFDEPSGTWTVRGSDGTEVRARYVVAATGNLSVPFIPNIPGREDFRGEQHHTSRWPKTPIDFTGKRVAQIGTGSSGVQIISAIADDVAQLTVYQKDADWLTPLNNAPITPEEQAELKADFESIRDTLSTSPSGFLHQIVMRSGLDDSPEDRQAFYEERWNGPGFTKLTEHYMDMLSNETVNAEWCAFMADKIRSIVKDPETADKLIPKGHGYGGRRPPFGTGYYETYNKPNVSLVDINTTPITRITEDGIETADGADEFDIIIWATGYDFGTGALNRLGVQGRQGLPLKDYWADGPRTYLGVATAGFPNFFFPGGPHGATGNNPRYAGDQVEIITDVIVHARDHGYDVIEVTEAAEEEWTDSMNNSKMSSFLESSYFYGGNIPGKPVKQLLNPTGRWALQEAINTVKQNGFPTFVLTKAESPDA